MGIIIEVEVGAEVEEEVGVEAKRPKSRNRVLTVPYPHPELTSRNTLMKMGITREDVVVDEVVAVVVVVVVDIEDVEDITTVEEVDTEEVTEEVIEEVTKGIIPRTISLGLKIRKIVYRRSVIRFLPLLDELTTLPLWVLQK